MFKSICLCGEEFETYKKDQRFCSHRCWASSRTRENAPNWRGGKRINANGYILVLCAEHPNADIHGYVFEHRLLMEKQIGRLLKSYEIIHHLDKNKQNNSIDNLTITRHGEHEFMFHRGIRKERDECINEYCKNITTRGKICRNCYKKQWRHKRKTSGIKYT